MNKTTPKPIETAERELKVTRNYSFWRHPIKWWMDRKKINIMNAYVNYQWEHGMREEISKMNTDLFLYGSAAMKDGRRINPETL